MEEAESLRDIIEVKTVRGDGSANEKLRAGWVLIGQAVFIADGESGEFAYPLGRPESAD